MFSNSGTQISSSIYLVDLPNKSLYLLQEEPDINRVTNILYTKFKGHQ